MLSEDMARNPMAVVQAQARPSVAGVVHPTVDGMTPDDPGFRKKIPPPDPMSPVELAAIEEEKRRQETAASRIVQGPGASSSSATPGAASPSTFRLLITCSRTEDHLVIGLERAPDWDVIETWSMTQKSARCVALVCRALGVRIKDMSEGELGVPDARLPVDQEPTIADSDPDRARDLAGDVPDVRGAGADHAGQPVGGSDPRGETGVRALDPGSTTEFLEEARRAYEAELARKSAGEMEPDRGETPSAPPDDREDALRRRLGLSSGAPVSGGVRGGARDPDYPPDGPDLLAPGEAPAQPE